MAERKAKKEEPESGQNRRKRVWSGVIAILALAIGCFFLLKTGLFDFQNVDEQLAAIEAARAIPDAENAAIIYNQLLENYDESEFPPDSLSIEVRRQPWLSKDYPEGAEWLKDMQEMISTLLEASKREKCRFPIITDPQQIEVQMDRTSAMRRWTRLLISAANNDIAEGRIDAGIQKYRSVIKMANHLCQQPVLLDYLVGIAIEDLALSCMKTFIVEGDVAEEHLKNIEAAIPQTKDNWAEVSSKIIEFETLFERKNYNLVDRFKLGWQGMRTEDTVERMQDRYLQHLANRRSNRIFIALRRYRNKNGRWPESLDSIKNLVPTETLVDPINGGSFVYKLTEENFTLYSKGENNIDEGGERNQSGADDCLIWPTSSRKSKKENTDTAQSNTQKDGVK